VKVLVVLALPVVTFWWLGSELAWADRHPAAERAGGRAEELRDELRVTGERDRADPYRIYDIASVWVISGRAIRQQDIALPAGFVWTGDRVARPCRDGPIAVPVPSGCRSIELEARGPDDGVGTGSCTVWVRAWDRELTVEGHTGHPTEVVVLC
jgi:hypothetical protein